MYCLHNLGQVISVVGFFIYTQITQKTGVPKRSCFVVSVVIMNYLPALIAACAE